MAHESRLSAGRTFSREIFSADTTMLAARSGRSLTAVATHEVNFGPTDRTAMVMNPVRNSSVAICATLFDARTVIGAAIGSSAGADCSAAFPVSESTAVSAKKEPHHPLFGPENIGSLAAHPRFLERRADLKSNPHQLT